MTTAQELDGFGRHPKLWTITAVHWVVENPDFGDRVRFGLEIPDPAKEIEMTEELGSVEAPDLEQAIAAAHRLLDKHADQAGEFALEIYVTPPQLPHREQERLGIKDYKLTPAARKRARAIGLRGRDLEARVAHGPAIHPLRPQSRQQTLLGHHHEGRRRHRRGLDRTGRPAATQASQSQIVVLEPAEGVRRLPSAASAGSPPPRT
jgi:hypothetical protein